MEEIRNIQANFLKKLPKKEEVTPLALIRELKQELDRNVSDFKEMFKERKKEEE